MANKYDIFISYSRKDYVDNNGNVIPGNPVSEIHRVLEENGISYWFDKEGIYSSSEFMPILIDAIEDSSIVVFVSSEHSNTSNWTAGEILEAHDQGKSIIPFKIDNSRYGKSFRIALRPLDFIDYTENPQLALENLVRSIKIIKEQIAKKDRLEAEERKKQEALARKKEIKEEILQSIPDYQRVARQLEETRQKLLDKKISIGEGTKNCPVCNKEQSISALFCDRCGFPFSPLYGIDPLFKLDSLQIQLQKSVWKACSDESRWTKRISVLQAEKEGLETEISSLKKRINSLISESLAKDNQIVSLKSDAEKTRLQLDAELNSLKTKLKKVTKELEDCNSQYIELQRRYEEEHKKRNDIESELNSEKNKSQNTTISSSNTFLPEGTILNDRYKIIQNLAQGGFGITYKAIDMEKGKDVAIKEYYLRDNCSRHKNNVVSTRQTYITYKNAFTQEASILASLNHRNIVKVLDVFEQNNTSYYVMEFIQGNTLNKTFGAFSQIDSISILINIADTLQYMHSHNVIHGDIAPKNIFANNCEEIKIIDFGMARHISDDHTTTTEYNGFTPGYSPLECYGPGEKRKESDVYSLGALAFFLISGQRPPEAFDICDNENLLRNILSKYNVFPPLIDTIEKAMALKLSNRISLDKFLTEIRSIYSLYTIGEISDNDIFRKEIITRIICPNCKSRLSIKTPIPKNISIRCPQCKYRGEISKYDKV